jgi:hypothetical protein
MTQPTEKTTTERLPSNMAFWLDEARALKEIADLSWDADRGVAERVRLLYPPLYDRVVRHATEELGMELDLLYRYLISLAIQHLAIGLLIDRDPRRFLKKPPGHKIIALVEACDITPSEQQKRMLQHTENALDWADRYPGAPFDAGSDNTLQSLNRILSGVDRVTDSEKAAMDSLYAELEARVVQELEHSANHGKGTV